MTAGLRPVDLAVAAKTVVLRRAVTVKGMAASQALAIRPVPVSHHAMRVPHPAVNLHPARNHHLRSQGQASRLFRTTPASARPVPRADR
jgi:hypothetical protein